jgi:hypothetical protein
MFRGLATLVPQHASFRETIQGRGQTNWIPRDYEVQEELPTNRYYHHLKFDLTLIYHLRSASNINITASVVPVIHHLHPSFNDKITGNLNAHPCFCSWFLAVLGFLLFSVFCLSPSGHPSSAIQICRASIVQSLRRRRRWKTPIHGRRSSCGLSDVITQRTAPNKQSRKANHRP